MLNSGPQNAVRLMMAHGAGAAMNSPFLEAIADGLAQRGVATSRLEFAYMAARRTGGPKRPPPKAEALLPECAAMLDAVTANAPTGQQLFIGGKSLGGRVASMIADEAYTRGAISGLVCLGYPFHAPGQTDKLRTAHLLEISCPTLIVQGARDPFGSRAEIEALKLSPSIQFQWISDGDHDFGPRGASGFTRKGNLAEAADAVVTFMKSRV